MDKIKKIIHDEVKKHEYQLKSHHIVTITDAIYKQLNEYMSEQTMEYMIESLRPEFVGLIDNLIPVVEDYESKVDVVLNKHMSKLFKKIPSH